MGADGPPIGSGVNAVAAICWGLAGLTARVGSLSWLVSRLSERGTMLTTRTCRPAAAGWASARAAAFFGGALRLAGGFVVAFFFAMAGPRSSRGRPGRGPPSAGGLLHADRPSASAGPDARLDARQLVEGQDVGGVQGRVLVGRHGGRHRGPRRPD